MFKFSKTLSFIIVSLLIVCITFVAYIIWITPISKADSTIIQNNYTVNEEVTLIETEEKALFVNLIQTVEETFVEPVKQQEQQNTNKENKTTPAPTYSVAITTNPTYPDGWLDNFNTIISQLQNEYPKGYYWNHANNTTNGSVTTTPCNHNINESYCNTYQGSSTIACGFNIGRQCAGFASMLSDRVFGKDAPVRIFYNYDDIRIGDQARINNNSHTVFIIDKTDDYVVVAECNADYKSCIINWGRKIYRNNLTGFYITRWQ